MSLATAVEVRHIKLPCRCNGRGFCSACGGEGMEPWPVCPVSMLGGECDEILRPFPGREIAYAGGTPALHGCINGHRFLRYADAPSYESRYERIEDLPVAEAAL